MPTNAPLLMLKATSLHQLQALHLQPNQGVLVATPDQAEALAMLLHIRNAEDVRTALMPVLLQKTYETKELQNRFDATSETSEPTEKNQQAEDIVRRLRKINFEQQAAFISSDPLRILAFMYSRNVPLVPVFNRENRSGYAYFIAGVANLNRSFTEITDLLDDLANKNMLRFDPDNIIHLCSNCHGNYLNYKECCPKCHSIHIETYNLLHHFSCACVAVEADFKKSGILVCPKCSKQLRHIGVDYDKPSFVYNCTKCHHQFQEVEMRAQCFDCNTNNTMGHLVEKKIGSYKLTNNLLIESDEKKTTEAEINTFKLFVKHEILRSESQKSNSYLICFRVGFREEVFDRQNKKSKHEIYEIIKSYVTTIDLVQPFDLHTYYVLLFDADYLKLQTAERIKSRLQHLMIDNLHKTNVEINVEKHKIGTTDSINELFNTYKHN